MDNQPSIDRGLLIPILIGGFSIVGILVVLLIGRAQNSPPEVPMTPSATPFQYLYLGTEPSDATESPGATEPSVATEVPTNFPALPSLPTPSGLPLPFPTLTPGQSVATPLLLPSPGATKATPNIILSTATRSRTPTLTSTGGTAVVGSTYDDTAIQLTYAPEDAWSSLTNVSEAYQGTLHVSTGIGDSVTFTFSGQEIHLFYQAGPSLGAITITIDSLGGAPLSQAGSGTQIKEWLSDELPAGNHIIVIQHFSGGSVNIDSLFIAGPTPTPTRTPTATP